MWKQLWKQQPRQDAGSRGALAVLAPTWGTVGDEGCSVGLNLTNILLNLTQQVKSRCFLCFK